MDGATGALDTAGGPDGVRRTGRDVMLCTLLRCHHPRVAGLGTFRLTTDAACHNDPPEPGGVHFCNAMPDSNR